MRKQKEKQPWNPFPLACLNVTGISGCAKAILNALATRSDYKGQTCVGHRRLMQDVCRSKQFVTDGLAELYEKKLVKASPRGRKKGQADWKTISSSVLRIRTATECNPTEQDHNEEMKSYPVGLTSPTEQDCISKCNPSQQGQTLQIESLPNLAEQNLTDSKKERRKEGTASVAPLPQEFTPEEKEQAEQMYLNWLDRTGFPFVEDGNWSDTTEAIKLIQKYGWDDVWLTFRGTFECPINPDKTGLGWKDFRVWAKNYELTRRRVRTWRNKLQAQLDAKETLAHAH